jgi:hypothetical protein
MVDQTEMFARHLVRALYYATDGKPCWWSLPKDQNDATKDAVARAVDRGWMLLEDHHNSVCLTDAGRELAEGSAKPAA